MPSTINGSRTTGHKCLFQGGGGCLSSFTNPKVQEGSLPLCSPAQASFIHTAVSWLCWPCVGSKRDRQAKPAVWVFLSPFLLSSLFPFPSLPPSVCSSLSPLSSPLSLNLLHCSWTSPWIKTLSKNPLFKVISNFSARLSEICLFEGRIRCDRRFIVT